MRENIIHTLATSYGWTYTDILLTPMAEVFGYMTLIERDKMTNYYMSAVAASIPHTKKPKEALQELRNQLRRYETTSIIDDTPDPDWRNKVKSIFAKY